MIFSVVFDPYSRLVCSTSDDRTVRLWKVTESESLEGSNINWQAAAVTLVKTMYAHRARVWRAIIRNDIVMTIGEVRFVSHENNKFSFYILIFCHSRIHLCAHGRSQVICLIKFVPIMEHPYGVLTRLKIIETYLRVELMELCVYGHPHATTGQK